MITFFSLIELTIVFLVLSLIATALVMSHNFSNGSKKQQEEKYEEAIKYYDNVI